MFARKNIFLEQIKPCLHKYFANEDAQANMVRAALRGLLEQFYTINILINLFTAALQSKDEVLFN